MIKRLMSLLVLMALSCPLFGSTVWRVTLDTFDQSCIPGTNGLCGSSNVSGYTFMTGSTTTWPGWTEVQYPYSGSQIEDFSYFSPFGVPVGRIIVEASRTSWQQNVEHLLWNATKNQNYTKAEADFFLDGDSNQPGFAQVLSDGTTINCNTGHAVWNEDQVSMVTLADNGTSWVAAYVGDPATLGHFDTFTGTAVDYNEYGILQRTSDGVIHRLAYAEALLSSTPVLIEQSDGTSIQDQVILTLTLTNTGSGWTAAMKVNSTNLEGLTLSNVALAEDPNFTNSGTGRMEIADNGQGCTF